MVAANATIFAEEGSLWFLDLSRHEKACRPVEDALVTRLDTSDGPPASRFQVRGHVSEIRLAERDVFIMCRDLGGSQREIVKCNFVNDAVERFSLTEVTDFRGLWTAAEDQ